MRIAHLLVGALAALILAPLAPGGAAAGDRVLVELFTSQGCNSCPPAEAFLREELTGRDDLLALEFHVDYWDRLGWPDPFAMPEATARQHRYGEALTLRYVYTPQMVIDGSRDEIGSRKGAVRAAIAEARQDGKPVMVTIDRSASAALLEGPLLGVPADLWLLAFDNRHETEVPRGENRGKRLINSNVVRHLERFGSYAGGARRLALPLDELRGQGRDGLVLIVQAPDGGPILGFARLDLQAEG